MRGFGISQAISRAPMALALAIAGLSSTAQAATQQNAAAIRRPLIYNTTGVINYKAGQGTIEGPSVLQFQGVSHASYTPKSGETIQLGQFVIPATAVPTGQVTTYDHTPFTIEVRAPQFDKTSTVPLLHQILPKFGSRLGTKTVTEASLLIRGELNGTVSPTGESNVIATIKALKPGGMGGSTQDHLTRYSFPIRFGDLKLPPEKTLTPPVAAQTILPTPAPEPSTIALFTAIFGGMALARRQIKA
ncbi:PEP-CTERM sorting domain-containing protein [Tundrisphaera lichenicola]|uniref:PEP-CTERM sorting domain-containing protein n=1 Tax=Tundrisphaera lichenicola TaxID=2029860 RepID=UPI003EB77627